MDNSRSSRYFVKFLIAGNFKKEKFKQWKLIQRFTEMRENQKEIRSAI